MFGAIFSTYLVNISGNNYCKAAKLISYLSNSTCMNSGLSRTIKHIESKLLAIYCRDVCIMEVSKARGSSLKLLKQVSFNLGTNKICNK